MDVKITKKQAGNFAALIKEQIQEFCNAHKEEYFLFLKSIKDVDKQASKELAVLKTQSFDADINVAKKANPREPPPP